MKKLTNISSSLNLPFHTVASLKERLEWFINLRWLAIIGVLFSVPVSHDMLKFKIGFDEIILLSSILIIINLFYHFIVKHVDFKNEFQQFVFTEIQIIIDLILISFLIHFAGGIGNPFYFIYIVHVILSGILFPGIVLPYLNAVIAAVLLTAWSVAEHLNLIPRYSLRIIPISLPILITALAAFYITNFAGIFIINNFMMGYRSLKKIIDEKNILLEKAFKDKSRAFRFAAHELKAPMIAIQSTLAVVKDVYSKDMNANAREMIYKAENRSSQLIDMIKDVITITRYNLNIEEPELEQVSFNEWLLKTLSIYEPQALQKNIKLNFIPSREFIVEIDKSGMEKVAGNLFSNAVRYTNRGGEVNVKVFNNNKIFGFSVADNGIGISKEDIGKIFEEFYRAKNAKEMERIGTGLGLNLVKEIVEYNRGIINVKSEPGKGSEFIVSFPVYKEENFQIPVLEE